MKLPSISVVINYNSNVLHSFLQRYFHHTEHFTKSTCAIAKFMVTGKINEIHLKELTLLKEDDLHQQYPHCSIHWALNNYSVCDAHRKIPSGDKINNLLMITCQMHWFKNFISNVRSVLTMVAFLLVMYLKWKSLIMMKYEWYLQSVDLTRPSFWLCYFFFCSSSHFFIIIFKSQLFWIIILIIINKSIFSFYIIFLCSNVI